MSTTPFPDSETTPTETDTAAPSVEELLAELLQAQKEHRAEVNALRDEINKSRKPQVEYQMVAKSAEQLYEERIAEIREHAFYCPGCGKLSKYVKDCTGKAEAPHPPIEMIPVDELLSGDPSTHTPAPVTAS